MKMNKLCLFALMIQCALYAVAQQNPKPVPAAPQTMKLFFEKVYLQTDRSYYNTGEDLWFSAFLSNAKSTSLTSTSNNLYVELISAKAGMLDRKIIRLDKGLGKGDFKLMDSIPSGWYNIRAYTNWMRNFGDDFIFQKRIYISNNLAENASYTTRTAGQTATAEKPVKSIAFFPEGGALVEGLTSIVAFKTNDQSGNGIKAKGSVISSKGDTITSFQCTDAGLGIFAFAPKAGETYQVSGYYGTEKFTSALPAILKKGMVLHVVSDSTNIKASISTSEESFKELAGKSVSILIKHGGDNVYTGSFNITKPTVSVTIPTKDFPQGVAIITLVDQLGRPNCERLVFINGDNKAMLSIKPDKTAYKPREKVTLNIKATDAIGLPARTSFSLAAADALLPDDGGSLMSYLLLQSEVKGDIKNAAQYFDPNNPSRLKQLDLLLLTQGWRDYLWRRIADSTVHVSYLPEAGLVLKGTVREKVGSKMLPDMYITLFGSNFSGDKLFSTKTDQNGQFFLDGLKWYGNQAIKLSSKDAKGKKGGWLQIDTLAKPPVSAFLKGDQVVQPAIQAEMSKRFDYNRKYKFGDSITLKDVDIKANKSRNVQMFDQTLMTFGYPEQILDVKPADYSYQSLEHFLLTKVNGAQPVDDSDSIGNEGVTFISNGKKIRPRIKVNNREELVAERLDYYSLTMDQITQVKVQHLVDMYSKDVFVISLTVKDGALAGGANLNLINTNLTGYYTARDFYSPNYSTAASPNKDLRTTIFWSPLIKTNEKGEAQVSFYNGDNPTRINIKTDGVTDKGTALSAKATYTVQ